MHDIPAAPDDASLVEAEAVAATLRTDTGAGLDESEAASRLAINGPNTFREKQPVPMWRRLLEQFRDPLVYLLLGATAVSLLAWWHEGSEGLPIEAVVIGVIVVANGLLGFLQEKRAERGQRAGTYDRCHVNGGPQQHLANPPQR